MASDMGAARQRAQGVDLGVRKDHFEKELASGAFAKRIQLTKQLAKEEEQLGKRMAYAESVARSGKLNAILGVTTQRLNEMAAAFKPISDVATKTFVAGTAAVVGFTAAASPLLMTTFTASIKWLAAAIGTAFVPIVAKATEWIQKLARWIDSLDPATKTVASGFVMFGIAIAGTIFVGAKLLILIADLITAFRALAVAETLAWLAAAGPFAVAALVAAAEIYLVYKVIASLMDVINEAKEKAAYKVKHAGKGPGGRDFTDEEINNHFEKSKEKQGGGLLLSAQQPAQFHEIADAWKQAQLAGASVGGPEGETLKIQREQVVVLQKIAANTERTGDAIDQTRMDKPPYTRQGTSPAPDMPGGVARRIGR